jgi:exosortase
MENHSGDGILEEFRKEFLDCWRRMPDKGFFLVLLAAWLALFHFLGNSVLGYGATNSLMDWMYKAYGGGFGRNLFDSDEMYGALIPGIVVFLFWLKRKELIAVPFRLWSPALLLVGFGLLLHIVGYLIQQPRLSMMGLFAGLYGLMGLTWGPSLLRVSIFPFFLLLFSIPLGQQAEIITVPLRLLVTKLVAFICNNLLAIEVIRDGNILRDPTGHYQYEVAAACSGIKSLAATGAFAVILGFLSFRTWWKRLLFIASGVPLAIMGNMIRLMSIVIAAEMGGKEWGDSVHEGGPHGIFALMLYVPSFAGLLALEYYYGDQHPARSRARKDGPRPAAARNVPQAVTACELPQARETKE